MNAKLIYLYILSFATCLMASCSDDVPDFVDDGNGCELTFEVADQSRASVTADLNFNNSQFAIYGNMKFKDYDPTVIFDKTIVKYNSGRWRYDNTQYWFPQHEHSFIAIHPVDATGVSDATYSDSRLSFTYTLPDDFKLASDLLAATHRRAYEENMLSRAQPVTFRFWHIMSRVNFTVKNQDAADNIRVTKIVLEGINKKGTFSIVPASLSSGSQLTDDYIYSWTDISNKSNLTANIQVDIPENEERPLFPDDNALLMVPQPNNNSVIMHITYTLTDAGIDDETLTLTAQEPIGGWKPGMIYNYTIAIEETTKEIYLTVSVKGWQTPAANGVTVPES